MTKQCSAGAAAVALGLLASVSSLRADPAGAPAVFGGLPAARIVASSLDVVGAGELTRVAFATSATTQPNSFVMANPDRVVVDLPEMEFRINPAAGRGAGASSPRPEVRGRRLAKPERAPPAPPLAGVVRSVRFGAFYRGLSRVVIDLAEPARIVRAVSEQGPDGQWRLVVELARTDRAAFLAAARRNEPVARAEAPANPKTPEKAPVIVIDAGHGGVDDGAHAANGTLEKDVALGFAQALSAQLQKTGRYKPVLTRASDIFIPLDDRVRIAREAGATLFVSIHADTLGDDPQVSGATVYTVSDKASDAAAARFAEKENQADAAAGLQGHEADDEVAGILFDLTRRETRSYSHVFARTLIGYVGEVARLNKNAQRAAGFRVLKAPDVPSVLLELGYLSNDKDAPNLASSEWRGRVANAVASAIDRFFAARGTDGGDTPERRLRESFNAEAGNSGAVRP